jgi:hypothetical protein
MKNDYECPKCHNIFPSQNRFIHDARCTEENPMALDQSRQIQLGIKQNPVQKEDNSNNDIKVEPKKQPEIKQIIKEPQNFEKVEQPIKKSSTSKEFPEILCEICGKTLPESEKKDHMYCHNLERQQNEQNELLNNIGNFGVSQREIEQQKKIEKMIKENNERRRIQSQQQNQRISQQNQRPSQQNQGHNQHNSRQNQQNNRQNQHQHQHQQNQRQNIQNQVNQRINNNRINNLIDSDDNILTDSDIQLFNQLGIHGVSNANSRPNNTSNQNQPHIRITRARTGPNGVTIFEQFGNDQSNIQRIMNNNNMMFPSMMTGNRNSSNRMFIPISNLNNINSLFEQIFSRARHHEHPTSQQILDALPETQIDDASKLDSEKKNCVICLEDFKNGDRATILPCIHLFHTNCIKNWLKTQDCCPICKYKLNGQNLNSNH